MSFPQMEQAKYCWPLKPIRISTFSCWKHRFCTPDLQLFGCAAGFHPDCQRSGQGPVRPLFVDPGPGPVSDLDLGPVLDTSFLFRFFTNFYEFKLIFSYFLSIFSLLFIAICAKDWNRVNLPIFASSEAKTCSTYIAMTNCSILIILVVSESPCQYLLHNVYYKPR